MGPSDSRKYSVPLSIAAAQLSQIIGDRAFVSLSVFALSYLFMAASFILLDFFDITRLRKLFQKLRLQISDKWTGIFEARAQI
jgi:hypothetical protein